MVLYHASNKGNIVTLKPNISNHNKALIYFSSKEENVAVYLSNAVEKFCKENGLSHNGHYHKWASYGFDSDGILRLEEYYPNATEETYRGVSGYIYTVDTLEVQPQNDIPFAYVSQKEVATLQCRFIPDAYEFIMTLVNQSKIRIRRYDELDDRMRKWIETTVKREFMSDMPAHYKSFLLSKFDFLD